MLRGVRGYYKNGQPVTSANWGDTITFDVPGHTPGTVFLDQRVNGQRGYFGPFQVPMAPVTLGPAQPQGTWFNYVYDKDPTQGGATLFEQSTLQIGGTVAATVAPVQPKPVIPSGYSGSTGSTTQGGVSDVTVGPGSSGTTPTSSAVATAIAPSLTPGTSPSQGGLPSGSSTGTTYGNTLSGLYRFILSVPSGFATGANYPGCSQTNSGNCDPQMFDTLQKAIDYANTHGEIAYRVLSAGEPWQLMAGTVRIDPARVLNGSTSGSGLSATTLGLLALGAYLLLRR